MLMTVVGEILVKAINVAIRLLQVVSISIKITGAGYKSILT